MFIEYWNIRGLNDPVKHSAFRCLVQKHSVALFGLVETHVAVNKDNVSRHLFQNWAYFFNYDHSNSGRIWLCWDPNVLNVDH
jgi:hypothetical protein